jgi:cohesin loading factor subunit SCC2
MKNRQRFLEKMCNLMDFDLTKLDSAPELPPHIEFTRFIVENLAFFEYQTVGELQTTVNLIEKMVASLGTVVAQAIEAEVFNVRMDIDQPSEAAAPAAAPGGILPNEQPVTPKISVDPDRLRQLTAASIVLLLMWEVRTHLRRLFGMGTSRHDSKAKALAKDLNKTPVKVQGVHGEKVWQEMQSHMNGLEDQERMIQKCTAFVELMNVDKEFQVVDEEDPAGFGGPSTPSEGEDDDGMDRGHKRKGSSTPGGRKKRARGDLPPRKRGRPRKHSVEHDADADHDGDWI